MAGRVAASEFTIAGVVAESDEVPSAAENDSQDRVELVIHRMFPFFRYTNETHECVADDIRSLRYATSWLA